MFRQVESESEGDYQDDYQDEEDGGTEDEAEQARVEELKEIAMAKLFQQIFTLKMQQVISKMIIAL